MSDRPPTREILRLAWPIATESVVAALLGLVDAFFVGRLGATALAGLGAASAILGVVQAIPFALMTGGIVVAARAAGGAAANGHAAGAGGDDRVRTAAAGILGAHLAGGLGLSASLVAGGLPLLGSFGLEAEAHAEGARFLAVFAAIPAVCFIAPAARAVLLGLGRTRAVMLAGIVTNVLHVVLDPVLIFGLGPLPPLGAAGVAWSLLLSSFAGGALALVALRDRLPRRADLAAGRSDAAEAFRIGLPACGEILLYGLSQAAVMRIASSLGTTALAAHVVLRRVMMLHPAVQSGLAQAAMTRVGQAGGAGDPAAGRVAAGTAVRFSVAAAALFGALFAVLPAGTANLFTDEPATAEWVRRLLPLSGLLFLPQAVNIVAGSALRGAGETRWMLYTQALGIVVVVAVSWGLAVPAGLGLLGLLVGLAVDEAVRAVLNSGRLRAAGRVGRDRWGGEARPTTAGFVAPAKPVKSSSAVRG